MASDQPSAQVGVPLGEVIGGYRLTRLIGAGSTSHVYLGLHTRLNRPAAIKVLIAELVDNPQVVQRMLTEARVVNDIRHPNIVDIIDFVDQMRPRRVALVMEHIAGPSVDSLRGGEPIPWRQSSGIAQQLVDAVEAAHLAGVIHRDLKPDNLLLASDPRAAPRTVPKLKVVDFGIAKVAGPYVGHQTATQTMLGTPAYMAPEQIAQSPPPSAATDVFAVGEILYELLSGQRAYRSARLSDVVRQKLRGEIPDLPLPPIPGRVELQKLIRRCLAYRPDERPPLVEVAGLLSALEALPEAGLSEPAGAATISDNEWAARRDVLSEATQLNELVGPEGQTQAYWRPEADDADASGSRLDEVTVGTSSPTHTALKPARRPGPGGRRAALEETEPFSSDEHDVQNPDVRDQSFVRHYDLDNRSVAQAETAMSAEAIDDPEDQGASTRRRGSDEDLPTRDALPSLDADTDPPGFESLPIAGAATALLTSRPLTVQPGEKKPLVPARDGGPPVATDDPLAKPWPSTVIRPKARGPSIPTRPASPPNPARPEPAVDPKAGRQDGWSSTLERAMKARSGVAPAEPAPASKPASNDRERERKIIDLGRPSALPPSPPPVGYGEAKIPTRVQRPATTGWILLLLLLGTLVLGAAILVVIRVSTSSVVRTAPRAHAESAVEVRSQPPEAFVEDASTGDYLGKTPVDVPIENGRTRKVRVFKVGFTARIVELSAGAPPTWVPLTRAD